MADRESFSELHRLPVRTLPPPVPPKPAEPTWIEDPRPGPLVSSQNRETGEWEPSMPEPFFGLRKRCECGAKFFTYAGYARHWRRVHLPVERVVQAGWYLDALTTNKAVESAERSRRVVEARQLWDRSVERLREGGWT